MSDVTAFPFELVEAARAAIRRDRITREQAEDALNTVIAAQQPQINGVPPERWHLCVLATLAADSAHDCRSGSD